ncbi:MAG: hypothetical protein M1813_005062 [Trichoglossum hirsutum]|jgi:hypothetical protein|nr:MAG: hypothetical protein M1813_005062 [Trichoglossum hirsutum]
MSSDANLEKLQLTLKTTLSLLHQFLSSLSVHPPPTAPAATTTTDPLPLLSTSASLTKAHTTKLSLLLLNPPFTPSAISSVLHDLSTGAVPVMMTSVELCPAEIWGQVLSHEMRGGVRRVLGGLVALVEEVSAQASLASSANGVATSSSSLATSKTEAEKPGSTRAAVAAGSRDSLASTGVVWEACDALIALQAKGLGGLVVEKITQYRDTLSDAISELKAWSGPHDDDGDDDDGDDSSSSPPPPPALLPLLTTSLKHLSLLSLLYRALLKHRLPPPTPAPVQKLNALTSALAALPDLADELACAFYDADAAAARALLRRCAATAREAATVVRLGWMEEEDAFGAWVGRWEEAVVKAEREMEAGLE